MTLLRGAWTTPRSTIGERPHTAPCFKCMNGSCAVTVANYRASQAGTCPYWRLEVLVYKERGIIFRGQVGCHAPTRDAHNDEASMVNRRTVSPKIRP